MTTRRKVIRSLIPALLLLALALLLARPSLGRAEQTRTSLDPDLLELLPPQPHLLVTVASLETLDQQGREFMQIFNDLQTDSTVVEISLLGLLEATLPELMERVSRDRPLAVALNLPPIMAQEKTGLLVVLPLSQDPPDLAAYPPQANVLGQKRQGDYLALYMEEPSEAPGRPFWELEAPSGGTKELATGLPGGAVNLAVDLKAIVELYMPMIEVGLGALAMQSAAAPDTTAGGFGSPPELSPEMIVKLGDLVKSGLGSVSKLGVGFRLDGGVLTKDVVFTPVEGSPLDPVDQPGFTQALELTGLLPAGGSGVFATAWDPGPAMDLAEDFYGFYLEILAQMLPQVKLDETWLAAYLDVARILMRSSASKVFMNEAGYQVCLASSPPAPRAFRQRLDDLIAGLGEMGLGWGPRPLDPPLDGGSSWAFDFDMEQMLGAWSGNMGAQADSLAVPADQIQLVDRMMEFFLPPCHILPAAEFLLMTSEQGSAHLTEMRTAAKRSRRAVDPEAARLAQEAGPGCLMVSSMDMAVMTQMMALLAELQGDGSGLTDLGNGDPVRLTSYLALDGSRYRLHAQIDLAGYLRLLYVLDPVVGHLSGGQECDKPEPAGECRNNHD